MHLTSFCKNCKSSIAYRAAKCNSSDDNFRKEDGGDGSKKLKGPDVMKTKSSYRTLPLIPQVETVLYEEQTKQGETNMSTTANIYSHVDSASKQRSAEIIGGVLGK